MEHEKIVEALSEYRDGALSAAERESVSRHLSGCADCSAVLADWDRLAKAFLRRPPAPTPFQTEAFVARVTARLPGAAWTPVGRAACTAVRALPRPSGRGTSCAAAAGRNE